MTTSQACGSLPVELVDEIHAVLLARYGAQWAAKWGGAPVQLVKADWARELAGMSEQRIRAALANLPDDYPPTAPQFRRLGLSRPELKPALPAPAFDPSAPAVREGISRLRAMRAQIAGHRVQPNTQTV